MNRADRRKQAKTNKDRLIALNAAARELMVERGDMRQAQSLFRQVLSIDPGDLQANIHLGVMEMWAREFRKAQEYFERAWKREPGNVVVLNNLGFTILEQGGPAEAIPFLEQALEVDPDHIEARINLARSLLGINQRDRALAEAKQAVAIRPDFGTAHFILGTVAQVMGQMDLATEALQKTIDLLPGHMEANFRLSRVIFDPSDPEACLAPGRESWEANPDNVEAGITWAELLIGVGRYADAIEVLEKFTGTEIAEAKTIILNALGSAHAFLGDYETAISWHKKAISSAPDDGLARFSYGRTLLWSDDPRGAREQFARAITKLPFSQDLVGMMVHAQKLIDQPEAGAIEAETLVVVDTLKPDDNARTIENLNTEILAELSGREKKIAHPIDQNRRHVDESWEAVLGLHDVEPIAVLRDLIHEKINDYIAAMPEEGRTHPMFSRKQFGLGSSGSHAETISNFDTFSYPIDQIGWFRLIYFIEVPGACGDEDAKAGWLRFGVPDFETPEPIKPDRQIKPVAGQVVIFPAYYWFGFNALPTAEDLTFISIQVNSALG